MWFKKKKDKNKLDIWGEVYDLSTVVSITAYKAEHSVYGSAGYYNHDQISIAFCNKADEVTKWYERNRCDKTIYYFDFYTPSKQYLMDRNKWLIALMKANSKAEINFYHGFSMKGPYSNFRDIEDSERCNLNKKSWFYKYAVKGPYSIIKENK